VPPATLPADLRHEYADINGIRMHYAEAGRGESVLFLHGFPECWYSWRHQMADFAPDYRVIAPDLRGFGETEARGPYHVGTLLEDVLSLLRHRGVERAHIVGHDWGGHLAWMLAILHPGVVQTLTVCNLPHPALMQRGLRRPRQLLRSWYVFAFQVPWIPERAIAARDYHLLARGMIRACAPGTFTKDDVRVFLTSWRLQGLGGGINWYRAAIRHPVPLPHPVPILEMPVALAWGENDPYLGQELTLGTHAYAADFAMYYLPGIGHWVQQEAPDAVNAILRQQFAKGAA